MAESLKTGDFTLAPEETLESSLEKLKDYLKMVFQCHKFDSTTDVGHIPLPNYDNSNSDVLRDYLAQFVAWRAGLLPLRKRVKLMLHSVLRADHLAREYSDSVVTDVSQMLPGVIHSAIVDTISNEAGSSMGWGQNASTLPEPSVLESADALFSFIFADVDEKDSDYAIMEWSTLDIMEKSSQEICVDLLKLLLRKCCQKYISVALDKIGHLPLTHFLQQAIASEACRGAWAALLKEEVVQSKDKPGGFFQTTPLGSLLALNPVPLIDRQTMTLEATELIDTILQKFSHFDCSEIREFLTATTTTVVSTLSPLLRELLMSEDDYLRQSAVEWVVAVLEKNGSGSTEANSLFSQYEICSDAYMLNFCQVLLSSMQDYHGRFLIEFDLEYYFARQYDLKLFRTEYRGLEPPERRGQCPKHLDSRLTDLFIMCQRAFSTCVAPAVDRLQLFVDECSRRVQADSESQEILMTWYNETVWGEVPCQLIQEYFQMQSAILLKCLETILYQTSSSTNISWFPMVHLCDMAYWITVSCGRPIDPPRNPNAFQQFLQFIIHYLRNGNLPIKLRACYVMTLAFFTVKNAFLQFMKSLLDPFWTEMIPILCRDYIKLFAIYGDETSRGCYHVDKIRCDLTVLFMSGGDHQRCLTMNELTQHGICRDFLSAVLETLICLFHSFVETADTERMRPAESHNAAEERRNQKLAPQVKECLAALFLHLHFLRTLTSNANIASFLATPPLSHRTAASVSWIVNVLCRSVVESCSEVYDTIFQKCLQMFVQSFIHIASADSQERDGFKALLGDIPGLKIGNLQYVRTIVVSRLEEDQRKQLDSMIKSLQERHSERLGEMKHSGLAACQQSAEGEESLLANIQTTLSPFQTETASLVSSHSFQVILGGSSRMSQNTLEVVEREIGMFPVHFHLDLNSTAFLVRDEERADVLRCVISGPTGTPYSRGLFVFDIFCPDLYPRDPPLVKFLTTGNGTANFSPRLRRNGSVSLSLLWNEHKRDDSRRWIENKSSFLDVVGDISLIFRDKESRERLTEIRDLTVRYALLEPLRNPPAGLENMVRQYFLVFRQTLLQQCVRWADACPGGEKGHSLRWHLRSLYQELQKLDHTAPPQSSTPDDSI